MIDLQAFFTRVNEFIFLFHSLFEFLVNTHEPSPNLVHQGRLNNLYYVN